jgi:hypothetical protein
MNESGIANNNAAPAAPKTLNLDVIDSGINFDKASGDLVTQKYTAKDGTVFTDQAAYATYQAALINADTTKANTAALTAQTQAAADAQKTNWIQSAKDLLDTYDLSALGDKYINLITTGGYSDNTAMIKLQSEPEWQTRFSANQTRLKQGLPALDPATYLSTEQSYKEVMIQAGLPESVYKDTASLGQLIAQDISPTEVQLRVNAAKAVIDNTDPYITQTLQQQFGLSKGDMILHVLDPKTAANVIAQKVQAAEIGGEAARQGLGLGTQTAGELAAQGVSQAQARTGFANIAQALPEEQRLAALYGTGAEGVGKDLMSAEFGTAGSALAKTQIQKLNQREIGSFSGSTGISKGSLGVEDTGIL